MPDHTEQKFRHFVLGGVTESERFESPRGGRSRRPIPSRNRGEHGAELLQDLTELRSYAAALAEQEARAGVEEGVGLSVEFESFPDIEFAFESLARERSGIELLNVRHDNTRTLATVFVPDGKLAHFERLITEYLSEKKDIAGRPRDNRTLIDAIRAIRRAGLRALWTDDPSVFPGNEQEPVWWEIWLPVRHDRLSAANEFRIIAAFQEIELAPGELIFPERTVLLARASRARMENSALTLNMIAELRRPKETAAFFDDLIPEEQSYRMDELLSRCTFESAQDGAHVCLLDTGVNRAHPFIEHALEAGDLHTIEPGWGTDDIAGHGTKMAGLALAGDLTPLLAGKQQVGIRHRLESVKLLNSGGGNQGGADHHGYLTTEAVARPEVGAPHRKRVFAMAVTARDARDRGRPTAWSAAIDRLAADADEQGANPRLFVISAGNIEDCNAWSQYPESNDTDSIHDPGQAWNALTVGAATDLVDIREPDTEDFAPVASKGGLSPFSTTSLTWQKHWPLKPDVLFEGGNAAKDSLSAVCLASLSLLTTHHRPTERLFTVANATSAATALGARMAASIMVGYPELWPEAVRGLIIQSAEWSDEMKRSFLPSHRPALKEDYGQLVRRCGWGVPNLDRALWSVSNSLTMVVQEELQPFTKQAGKQPTMRDMHLHTLPWPKEVLEELGETQVEMRVTLSYFIEPNPSSRGVQSRYRYQSHGLRFDVKRPAETVQAFRARVNVAARDEEEGTLSSGDSDFNWILGKQIRHRGSIHSDIWRGSAADLASREVLAVYPALGWWRTRPHLERYGRTARYALIVAISAPRVETDLYAAVANQVGVPVAIEI